MHNRPRTHRQYAAFSWANHHDPGLLRNVGNLTYRARRPSKMKRPMNSWMGFRAFYSRLFPNMPQKDASTYLTQFWKLDPFKAKWTIVARAYSKIRDEVGKPKAPLDRYLKLVCPQIGLISVEEYLQKMNWVVYIGENGAPVFYHTSEVDVQALGFHIAHTLMSENDVVHFCSHMGYLPTVVARKIAGPNWSLASAPIPQSQAPQQSLLASGPALPATAMNPLFLMAATADPASVASAIFGFDLRGVVKADPEHFPQTHEWTGSMADLYNPAEGSIDFEHFFETDGPNEFNATDISDPAALNKALERGLIQHGFVSPSGKLTY
jgi:hypothetical protein